MRVVTRGNATTYGGGHPPEHDLAGSVRTQVWDWEGTRQSHEKNGKRTTACAWGCTRKLNGVHAKGASLQLQNFLREVSHNERDAATGGRVYHDLAATTPVDRPRPGPRGPESASASVVSTPASALGAVSARPVARLSPRLPRCLSISGRDSGFVKRSAGFSVPRTLNKRQARERTRSCTHSCATARCLTLPMPHR